MKIYVFPVVGTLLLAGSMVASAKSKTATPEKIKAARITEEPYRFNGVVFAPPFRGSGFCAWNKRTFFSAAHVVYDESAWSSPPIWYPAVNAEDVIGSKSVQSRGYYHWTGYADLVAADNTNAATAFGEDIILGYAFENLIKGSPATLNLNGSNDLKRDIKTMITGYPAMEFYTDTPISGYFLHKTGPTITPYENFSNRALTTTLVSTGQGNSGGPIWTRNPKSGWSAAGVLVGGMPSETVVYSFSKDLKSLLRAVTPVVQPEIESPVAVGDVTATSFFYPYNRAREIPDGKHKWTSFRLRVGEFEDGSQVEAVRLSLNIKTTHRGDLQVLLEGPSGIQVIVHNEEGANKDNLVLKGEDYTADFTGIDPNGDWFLRVQDRLTGDIATLKSILLEISAKAP